MKLPFKIVLINTLLAVIFAFLFSLEYLRWSAGEFFIWFGLVGIFGGGVDLIVGLFLLLKEDKRYAQGFLLSGGILMLLGFASCSTFR